MPMSQVLIRRVFAAFLLIFLSPVASAAAPTSADGYRAYAIGDTHARTSSKTAPALMLMGGGDWVDEAFRWFAGQAGHGHVVILRASGADDLQQRLFERVGGVASVQTLVFDDRKAASDARVLAIVGKADGIFIAGGDQSRYVRFWKGTPLNALLDKHVRDGKPLGGTSAGLAILGGVAYGALDGGSITSAMAMADPLGPAVTLDSGFLHMPRLARVITDTHFAKRERLGRLLVFLARAHHDKLIDAPIGLGVDENSVLCVDADGFGRLYTMDNGVAWLVRAPPDALGGAPATPMTLRDIRLTGIGPGSRIDLNTLKVEQPAFESSASVEDGVLRMGTREPDPAAQHP